MNERDDPNPEALPGITERDLQLFGRRIAQRRRTRGWNQKQLAERAAIEPARLSRLERGKAVPKLEELMHLRTVLGGTVDELIFDPAALSAESLCLSFREVESGATEEQLGMVRKLMYFLALGFRCALEGERSDSC